MIKIIDLFKFIELEFKFDDLFLTGVDPLFVEGIGGTKSISINQDKLKLKKSYFEPIAMIITSILIGLIFLF